MDDIDRASEREQELTQEALSKRMPEGPKFTGYCLQCGAEFGESIVADDGMALLVAHLSGGDISRHLSIENNGRRWCDSQCRDDWERAQTKG